MDRAMERDGGVDKGRLVTGLVLVALGAVFLLDRLWLIDARAAFRLWPLWLIGFGVLRVLLPPRGRGRLAGFWPILVGGVFLLDILDVMAIQDSWPLFIAGAGLVMVLRAAGADRRPAEPRS